MRQRKADSVTAGIVLSRNVTSSDATQNPIRSTMLSVCFKSGGYWAQWAAVRGGRPANVGKLGTNPRNHTQELVATPYYQRTYLALRNRNI